ncbi:MAG TPA: radical SAM protein [Candidatus Xenobia bacterium]
MREDQSRFRLLWASLRGDIREDADFLFLGRSGRKFREPRFGEMIPAPPGTQFHYLPGRLASGRSLRRGRTWQLDGRLAVAAVLPTGYARTLLPAYERQEDAPTLPLFGYTACAAVDGETWVAAIQTEDTFRWDPSQYDTPDLPRRIEALIKQFPKNRILPHLRRCALDYHCYTAQNTFYGRWEGAIPVSPACNAVCIGCISEQEPGRPPSPQERLDFVPTVEEIAELTVHHLQYDKDAMMSFGQGCEGEPTLQADLIARSIKAVRQKIKHGTLHLNSNASNLRKLAPILEAGLDSIRVSLNSVNPTWYEAYYRPRNYTFADVEASVRACREAGLYISLNLLFFPGVNDLPDELDRLMGFIQRYRIDKVQMRNLNIDPEDYLLCLGDLPGNPTGIPVMIERLKDACPWLAIGNFSPPVSSRS